MGFKNNFQLFILNFQLHIYRKSVIFNNNCQFSILNCQLEGGVAILYDFEKFLIYGIDIKEIEISVATNTFIKSLIMKGMKVRLRTL